MTRLMMILPAFLALACVHQLPQDSCAQEYEIVDPAVVRLVENVRVPARSAGVMMTLKVREGEMVLADQVLAELDRDLNELDVRVATSEYEMALVESRNDVNARYAEKSTNVAAKVLERSRNADQRVPKSVSKTEIERLKLEFDRAQLSVEQADLEMQVNRVKEGLQREKLNAAQYRLSQREIRSPIDGMLVETLVRPGEWVNAGDPIMRVLRLDRLRVQAYVDSARFDKSILGNRVELTVNQPPDGAAVSFAGQITFVSPEVTDSPESILIWAEIENPNLNLRPGTKGTMKIFLDDQPERPAVESDDPGPSN